MGCEFEDCSLQERCGFISSVQQLHTEQSARIDQFIQNTLNIDPLNPYYQASRHYTNMGLTLASAAYGAYGAARAGIGLWRASYVATSGLQLATATPTALSAPVQLNRFHQAAKIYRKPDKTIFEPCVGGLIAKDGSNKQIPLGSQKNGDLCRTGNLSGA